MDPVRWILLAGLISHKAVWEVMKGRPSAPRKAPSASPAKRLVKLLKLGVLAILLAQCLFLDVLPMPGGNEGRRAIGLALFLVGLAVAVTGRIQLGRNWADLEDFGVESQQTVVTKGIYRYIRHPIYAGDVLLVTGLELALNSWLVLGALPILAVVVKQSAAEEALLARRLPGYAEYCARTKRFVPFLL